MQQDPTDDAESLESLESTDDSGVAPAPVSGGVAPAPSDGSPGGDSGGPSPKKSFGSKLRRLVRRVNIYLLGFILLLVLAGAGGGIYYLNTKNSGGDQLKTQSLSTDSLKQLANTDVSVGDSKQVLTVQSNAIFAGSVLLRGDVEVAGKLVVGNQLSLTGINVSGESTLQDVKVSNDLAVSHNLAVQGQTTLRGNLAVTGNTTFDTLSVSRLTVSAIQVNSTLNLTHHIVAGGSTPSRSSGTALGSGGTASVSGSDTSGSIKVNTGGGPAVGCFITVNFTQNYSGTPHVIVTPVGSAAGKLSWYVNRTTSGFSVCTASTPPSGSSFGFDYVVLG